ncbi:methyltransferase domain-containing protein [Ruminococcus sp.]|uniref:methyltransferase domain-containing protein n=1 Tax=Ruminococcus sp. TaxID=41978 RepID=UPI00300F0933
MGNLSQHLQSMQQQSGWKGALKRKLFGWCYALFQDAEQDRAALEQQLTAAQQENAALSAQLQQLRQDFEQACVNLRNNNSMLANHQGDIDCCKMQLRQMERKLAAAPAVSAAAPADTAAPVPAAPPAEAPRQAYDTIEYFDFENHFRGSVEHIKEVQRQYLPYFQGKQHVLDIGCGRGEFLSLMQEEQIPAEGIDLYQPYVDYCNLKGLRAVCGDGTAYLAQLSAVDGIFLGQVVEHMTPEQILTLCRTAYDKLEDGGCLVIETPNPTSLSIYTNAFYIDPSHVKPVHPLTMQYYLEKAGFSDTTLIFTENSRPAQSIPPLRCDAENLEEFNRAMKAVSNMLYGSQDYAIVAVKKG